MSYCVKCDKKSSAKYNHKYCSIDCFKADLPSRMNELKSLKQQALEQAQLHAEFMLNPNLYNTPSTPKTEAELKLDQAFNQVKEKLHQARPLTEQEKLEQAFNNIARKSAGL